MPQNASRLPGRHFLQIPGPTNVPELEAHQGVLVAEPTYGVRFTCRELWGADAGPGESVTV